MRLNLILPAAIFAGFAVEFAAPVYGKLAAVASLVSVAI